MRFFVQQDAMQPMLRGYGVWRRVPNLHAYSTCLIPFNVVMRCLYIAWGWVRGLFPYYETTRAYWERRAHLAERALWDAEERICKLRAEMKRNVDMTGRRARIALERLDVVEPELARLRFERGRMNS
jgi:hypothetical protein